ncbi:MAG: hypothetical protein U0Z26_08130 [Anaerolineales bacterium]
MTNTWYVLSLGDGMMADEPADEIRKKFLAMENLPAEAAVFKRLESEGRLHCEAFAFFSPAATELAKAFGASPCSKPVRSGLGLLVGDEKNWELLFPEIG